MADKVTYPKITRKIWWLLRARLKQTVPTSITPTYISSVSEMTDASAKGNVIAPLREMLLIDENSKPTDLMERWRHDDEYASVCTEIRGKVYPHELIEAFPSPTADQEDRIKAWFSKNAKVGDAAARMYTTTYVLLSEADPSKTEESRPKANPSAPKPKKEKASTESKVKEPQNKVNAKKIDREDNESEQNKGGGLAFPSIHIDVQVHISPDTSAEQIDKIFESMSKHLTKFKN
ncbi:MAG TPA: DUF5343 domain-containing protein [Pyrinomonadaceae bacterium]|nr:DUF5343 domain-containing protein [Pyrinomonadaceae bacterium]